MGGVDQKQGQRRSAAQGCAARLDNVLAHSRTQPNTPASQARVLPAAGSLGRPVYILITTRIMLWEKIGETSAL